jgi:hypothetical protein
VRYPWDWVFIRDYWPAHQTFFLTHQRNAYKVIRVNIWLQNYNFVCIYMGVKLGLSHWENNIDWKCYWNNFMYVYTYMGVKLGLSHWEKNIEWKCYWNNFMYIYTYMGVKLGLSHWEKNTERECY